MDDRFVNMDTSTLENLADELETAALALKSVARYVPSEHEAVREAYEAATDELSRRYAADTQMLNWQYEEMIGYGNRF